MQIIEITTPLTLLFILLHLNADATMRVKVLYCCSLLSFFRPKIILSVFSVLVIVLMIVKDTHATIK